MKQQSDNAQKGEIEFRKELSRQQINGDCFFENEYDAKGIEKILIERMKKTYDNMVSLRGQNYVLSPYLEIGAERCQRSLVMFDRRLGASPDRRRGSKTRWRFRRPSRASRHGRWSGRRSTPHGNWRTTTCPRWSRACSRSSVNWPRAALGMVASIGGGILMFVAAFIIAGIIMAFGAAGDRAGHAIFARIVGVERGTNSSLRCRWRRFARSPSA